MACYLRKPVLSTALRTSLAVNGVSKAPSGVSPEDLPVRSRPATDACRASIVRGYGLAASAPVAS
jgi:hypothetical protein